VMPPDDMHGGLLLGGVGGCVATPCHVNPECER
jgi:hypothetical protein